VELFRDDEPVATLYQEPWVFPFEIAPGTAYLRAVARLEDGTTAEDLLLVTRADYAEELEVRLVEVFATVVDPAGRALHDLDADEFRISESGRRQEILRFERLEDLPLHVTLLVDTSASMAEHLPEVRKVAQGFFEAVLRPGDRASLMTFAERPREATPFTGEPRELSAGLAGLAAGRGTALWDSIVHAVYGLQGTTGQRALVLLSDGEDRQSRFDFEEAARYATSAGVTIYAVALQDGTTRASRARLERLAELTGGRGLFLDGPAELGPACSSIEEDLRSRYLLVYQAPEGGTEEFREVEVEVTRPGSTVRALRGYVR
jgi:VWFA-related protein